MGKHSILLYVVYSCMLYFLKTKIILTPKYLTEIKLDSGKSILHVKELGKDNIVLSRFYFLLKKITLPKMILCCLLAFPSVSTIILCITTCQNECSELPENQIEGHLKVN